MHFLSREIIFARVVPVIMLLTSVHLHSDSVLVHTGYISVPNPSVWWLFFAFFAF